MPPDDAYFAALTDDAHALATLDPPDLAVRVPACPDWTVADLLGHLGGVHRWATALVLAPHGERVRRREIAPPPDGDAVVTWCAEAVAGSLAALRAVDLDGSASTWAGPAPRRWWLRRLAHETAVHRVDLDQSLGGDRSWPGDLAVDAVDEWLDVFVASLVTPDQLAGLDGTIHLHRTDDLDGAAPGEWLVAISDGTVTVDRTHAKGEVAARGPASTLALVLWRRAPVDDLELFGNRALLDGLVDRVRF